MKPNTVYAIAGFSTTLFDICFRYTNSFTVLCQLRREALKINI